MGGGESGGGAGSYYPTAGAAGSAAQSQLNASTGFDWPAFLQSTGKAVSNFELGGQTPPRISTDINYPQSSLQIPTGGSEGSGLIPATGQSDTAAVMEMLKRLLSQGGGGY